MSQIYRTELSEFLQRPISRDTN